MNHTNRSSWIWQHFIITDKQIKVCKICAANNETKEFGKKTGNTSLIKHLANVHKVTKESCKISNETSIDASRLLTSEQKEELNNKLVKMIISRKESLRSVEDPYLIDFFHTLNPYYHLPTRPSLVNKISLLYDKCLEQVKTLLQNTEGKIAITGDGWSSRQSRSYFVSTGHFISRNWKLKSCVIDFSHFPSPHDAINTSKIIKHPLEDYKIAKKISAATTDNASEMILAIKMIGNLLEIEFGCRFDYDFHVRCLCHVLNLAIQDCLALLKGLLEN